MPEDTSFKTGATRSADANGTRFDLIHPVAMLAVARTYAEGAAKYGDVNWERGMPVGDLLNHALRHIFMYLAGDRTEPHLPHAAWGVMAAIASDTLWPEINRGTLRGPGCTLTADVLARQEAGDAERRERRAKGEFDHLGDWNVSDIPEVVRILGQRVCADANETTVVNEPDFPPPQTILQVSGPIQWTGTGGMSS